MSAEIQAVTLNAEIRTPLKTPAYHTAKNTASR